MTSADPRAIGATPALAQWFAAKAAHPDAMLFFRMGDFFELFFEDAEAAGQALDIAVSHRGEHQGRPVPMAGVPAHAHEAYLARLIRQGFRVAICDQMETPEQAKQRRAPTIRREVTRVVTPATVTEDGLLEAGRPAWLLALAEDGAEGLAAAWLDISTGAFCTLALSRGDLGALLARIEPTEAVAPPALTGTPDLAQRLAGRIAERAAPRDPARLLREAFGVATLDGFGRFTEAELAAAALALAYVQETQVSALPRLDPPRSESEAGQVLVLDAATRRSLEILRDQRGGSEATLLAAVDRTLTAAGARELAARLAAPLAARAPIVARHEAVGFLVGAPEMRAALRVALKGAPDAARALARLALDRFAPRDLAALLLALQRMEACRAAFLASPLPPPDLLGDAVHALRLDPSLAEEFARALNLEKLPARIEDGGVIAAGFDGELDALRRLRDGARDAVAALQMELASAWGVASLKIRHHQQFGFLAEVPSAAGQKLIPPPAGIAANLAPIHRQTMANAMRFTCAALAELDRKVSEAGERAQARERACIAHLRGLALAQGSAIAAAARALAEIDVHAGVATLAEDARWCRPEMTEGRDFAITAGRHPVVEAASRRIRGPAFVPNDCDLSAGQRLCLLTGPNMAGKSTWLRQNALMAVLAQAGLFVPAEAARIGVVDRLFSRVGGGDDIAGGRSTFMVEMAETAAILNQATAASLVVLDEVGRGTATWDGLAIAWAVLEALHDRIRARAIFATHFHELTALAGRLPELRLASLKVTEYRGEVVFRHQVVPGAAERSWGVHVAKLAGVPRAVLARAGAVLRALEDRARSSGADALAGELPLFSQPLTPSAPPPSLVAALRAIDPDAMTPREAQEALYHLRALLAELDAAQQEKPVIDRSDTLV